MNTNETLHQFELIFLKLKAIGDPFEMVLYAKVKCNQDTFNHEMQECSCYPNEIIPSMTISYLCPLDDRYELYAKIGNNLDIISMWFEKL